MSAAFELSRPEHEGRYALTVYQLGWRIGGKGASGRGPGDRIEEHGLHLWMGFYDNAFRVMRECYEQLDRDPDECPIATWRDAFAPDSFTGIADRSPSGEWLAWRAHLPPAPGLPGDPYPDGTPRWSVAHYLGRSITLVRTLIEAVQVRENEGRGRPSDANPDSEQATGGSTADAWSEAWRRVEDPEQLIGQMGRLVKYGRLASLAAVLEALQMMELALGMLPAFPDKLVLGFHRVIKNGLRAQIDALIETDDEIRRLWEIVDLTLAIVHGCIRHRILTDPRGFDALDEWDCREWLQANGASAKSTDSGFVRALYDLAFGYEDGDVTRPRIAAGQAVRGAVRAFFTYRGAFFWKMRAGMGDIVFSPFYEVLKARGVRFEYFHRLTNMVVCDAGEVDADGRSFVEALEFDVQAEVVGGAEYQPLVDVRGLPCWPAQPDWDQLVGGEAMREAGIQFESHWEDRIVGRKTLRVTDDFDIVVLGVGVGAVRYVARELIDRSDRWREMVTHCKSVATQAFQLWMDVDMKELGWHDDQVNVSGFVEPFDTWADMRQLIPEESFTTDPKALGYFCSVLPDPESGPFPGDAGALEGGAFRAEQFEAVRDAAVTFLDRDVVHLWPDAHDGDGFRWEVVVGADPEATAGKLGPDRFDSQFWTANVDPTSRYALALPGTLRYRISPLDDEFDNLTICGDYTDCGFNEGCVEAAVMSGLLAAHAVSGSPSLDAIVGYDHP
jgi:uncharacterized protein with NAD-binding domain and iron-sulfur cluster